MASLESLFNPIFTPIDFYTYFIHLNPIYTD